MCTTYAMDTCIETNENIAIGMEVYSRHMPGICKGLEYVRHMSDICLTYGFQMSDSELRVRLSIELTGTAGVRVRVTARRTHGHSLGQPGSSLTEAQASLRPQAESESACLTGSARTPAGAE